LIEKPRSLGDGMNMKRWAVLLLAIVLFSGGKSGFAQDLFLCKNVFVKEPIRRDQIQTLKESQSDRFRPGNRITAVLIFHPREDGRLEFRWIAPFRGRQPQPYVHRVKQPVPGGEYTAYAWLVLDSNFLDGIMGSRYAGRWRIETYFDGRKISSQSFWISN
jgi:hypothetical protein